jgi:hypothetical protein
VLHFILNNVTIRKLEYGLLVVWLDERADLGEIKTQPGPYLPVLLTSSMIFISVGSYSPVYVFKRSMPGITV